MRTFILCMLFTGSLAAVEIGPLPVVKVADGDVIVVQLNGKEERVRLLYINTAKMSEADPASPMPERRRAREMLQSCFAVRSDAWLWSPNETIERDKDQTLLAVVKYEAPLATGPVLKYVQSEMVHNGHSVYWRGMGDAPEPLHGELIKEQEHAQKNKMQAWSTAPDWMSKKAMERPAPSAPSGPAPAPAPAPTASSQAGNSFLPCAIGFFGDKLVSSEANGFIATVDRMKLKMTKVGDHYEMEPMGIPGPKPTDFKAPLVTVGDSDVTYDAGPMVVLWKMDQIFDLPQNWTNAERINGKGPLATALITIQRRDGVILVTMTGAGGRPETWEFKPF